jgi:hypothetical protein
MPNQYTSRGLSLARGFTVLIMPAVHTVLLYSSKPVKIGILGQVLTFLAEGPGAELFMFLMGVFIVLGQTKSTKEVITRSIFMLTLGYLLNLIRFTIPFYLKIIPDEYLLDNGISIDNHTDWNLLIVNDILQFASIAYLLCSIVHRCKTTSGGIIFLLISTIALSPYTWTVSLKEGTISGIISLFNGTPPQTFFPVFPWLFYPLFGLLFARIYLKFSFKHILLIHLLTGMTLIVFGVLVQNTEPPDWRINFYRPGRGDVLCHAGFVLLWLVLFILLAKAIKTSLFLTVLLYLSRHITIIYLIQWIIILWMFPLFGYNRLNFLQSCIAIIITSSISFLLPKLWTFVRAKYS